MPKILCETERAYSTCIHELRIWGGGGGGGGGGSNMHRTLLLHIPQNPSLIYWYMIMKLAPMGLQTVIVKQHSTRARAQDVSNCVLTNHSTVKHFRSGFVD